MKTTIFAGFIALILFFAGCASTPTNENAATTTLGQQDVATTQAGTVTTVAMTTQTTVAASESKTGELLALFSNAVKDYMVTYNVKTSGDPSTPATSNDMTYYYKGEDKIRIDSAYVMSGQTIQSRSYLMNNEFVSCTTLKNEWSCIKLSNTNQKDPAQSKKDMEDNIRTSSITQTGDRVVAGINTKCYKLVMSITNANAEVAQMIKDRGLENWEGTYCVSGDGILLYSESTSKNIKVVMEAKSYKKGTTDADFTLPAQPTDMSSITGGGSTGQQNEGLTPEQQKLIDDAMGKAQSAGGN